MPTHKSGLTVYPLSMREQAAVFPDAGEVSEMSEDTKTLHLTHLQGKRNRNFLHLSAMHGGEKIDMVLDRDTIEALKDFFLGVS